MPNWRDEDDYAYTEGLHARQWAWEFLRRNPRYRARYNAWIQGLEAGTDSLGLFVEVVEPFGLEQPCDPDCDSRETSPSWIDYLGRHMLEGEETPARRDPLKRFLSLQFDLSKSLPPQIKRAKDHLTYFQGRLKERMASYNEGIEPEDIELTAPTRQFSFQTFPTLIRLLDAKEDEVISIGEMGRVLFPDKADNRRSAKQALKRAEDMAESGYRDLLLIYPGDPGIFE